MEPAEFETLLNQIRSGDQDAARRCVEYFEPELRRVARVRLRDPRLQSIADSMDITQSVFGRFFQRYAAGRENLGSPDQMLALLVTMTKNRVIDLARKHKVPAASGSSTSLPAAREVTQLGDLDAIIEESGPSKVVASQDLAAFIRSKLTADEYDLVDRRNEGQGWDEIAAAVGRSAESLRKQLARALQRVRNELGVE